MAFEHYIPALSTLFVGSLALLVLSRLARRGKPSDGRSLAFQLIFWAAGLAMLVALIVALPLDTAVRGQILSLLGVVLTAVIALSSTTFVSNAMAGIMLQATRPFKPGDFILVDGVFGRVSRRSLVSTRIQTETRDFTNLPNLLLVTQPVTVQHRDGTIIQADVSLGYDVHHNTVERELLASAELAGLKDPYVLVVELLDHAVVYRAAGFLEDVVNPLTARSQLRRKMLDGLHGAGLEIASPSIVAQRQQPGDTQTLPTGLALPTAATDEEAPEAKIFDRANAAASEEALREEIAELQETIASQREAIKGLEDEEREKAERALERLQRKLEWLESRNAQTAD